MKPSKEMWLEHAEMMFRSNQQYRDDIDDIVEHSMWICLFYWAGMPYPLTV